MHALGSVGTFLNLLHQLSFFFRKRDREAGIVRHAHGTLDRSGKINAGAHKAKL